MRGAAILAFSLLLAAAPAAPGGPSPGGEEAAVRSAAAGEPAAAAADGRIADGIRGHLLFLADDALRGRETGSAEYEIAARYLAARFRALGLEPAGAEGGYLQPVPMVEYRFAPGSAAVEVHRGEETLALEWLDDFVMAGDPVREETAVTAPVVFVGYGVTAPELGWDDYAEAAVEGKIVLTLSGAPASFPHNQRAFYSSGRTKREQAVRRGAVGALRFRTAADAERVPWERITRNPERPNMSWLHPDGAVSDYSPELGGFALLSHRGAGRLLAGSGRSLEEVLVAAAEGAVESFELPVRVTLRVRSSQRPVTSPNVAAVLPGSDPELGREYVVYTAHLDHVGVGAPEDGDAIYNGAYDNAAGVAVLLETARLFAELPVAPRRSILFLAVTGEENGLLGSEYFAHFPTVPRQGIVANVNLDMPLFLFPLADLVAFGAEHSSLGAAAARAAAAAGFELSPDPMPEEVFFIRSDQYSFVRQGVPAVFLVPGRSSTDPEADGAALWREFLRRHYHMPSDDLSRPLDGASAARFTRANFFLGLEVANADERPRWKPGDFFGERFSR